MFSSKRINITAKLEINAYQYNTIWLPSNASKASFSYNINLLSQTEKKRTMYITCNITAELIIGFLEQ